MIVYMRVTLAELVCGMLRGAKCAKKKTSLSVGEGTGVFEEFHQNDKRDGKYLLSLFSPVLPRTIGPHAAGSARARVQTVHK